MRFALLASLAAAMVAPAALGQTFSNPTPITIPTSGSATPYPSGITVAGVAGNVAQVTVTISNYSHTFASDVDMLLVGPTGTASALSFGAMGDGPVANLTITFNQAAAVAIPQATPASGSYRPANYFPGDILNAPAPQVSNIPADLSLFNGTNPNGTWSLYVQDFAEPDGGSIANGWSLTVVPVPEPACVLAAGCAALAGAGWLRRRAVSREVAAA